MSMCKAEASCGRDAGFFVFPYCSGEGRAVFPRVAEQRGSELAAWSCATGKSSSLGITCAHLIVV